VQTLQGALLGDLALEHQLRDRARYARVMAQSLGETQIVPVLDRLDAAHTETIGWLETRLAEVGRTGTSALRATPVQLVTTTVRRAASAPAGLVASGVNRAGGLLTKVTGRAPQPVQDALQQVEDAARTAADTAKETAKGTTDRAVGAARTAGARTEQAAENASEAVIDLTQAAAERAEDAAETVEGAVDSAAQSVEDAAASATEKTEQALRATGGSDVEDDKPPFAGYDKLTGDSVMRHVDDTEDVEQLRTLLAYEQAHKARKGVLQSAQERLDALATV
jgi:type IV secretory pathway VirB10-like protein